MNKQELQTLSTTEEIKNDWIKTTIEQIPHKIATEQLERDTIFILDKRFNEGIMFVEIEMLPENIATQKRVLSRLMQKMNIIAFVSVAFATGTSMAKQFLGQDIENAFVLCSEDGISSEITVYEINDDKLELITNLDSADNYFEMPYVHLLREPFSVS